MTDSDIWFTPVFWDDDGWITSGSYDTAREATEAGVQAATEELRFIGVARRVGYRELARRATALRVNSLRRDTTTDDGRWRGIITRWASGERFGFIVDGEQRTWFVPDRDELPDAESLAYGHRVMFTGSPHSPPGKKYPNAYSVRPDDTEA